MGKERMMEKKENSQDDSVPRNPFRIKETKIRAKSKAQLSRPPENRKGPEQIGSTAHNRAS